MTHSFALSQVGGLKIIYNRRGQIINVFGTVKGYNSRYYNDYNHPEYDQNESQNNYNNQSSNSNDDYYYYKTDGTKSKIEISANDRREG
ncbi:hypothetical protein [Flavobacterium psychrophilum]|uniref:hypothetical protein n=1 Tax=Flavobacterium psychrophilum TaxID=96345 RepID=UPI001D05CC65|nr:hypothetical protein [Flavobacterium psychrophilum]MCB6088328.1 hypothetical protein [Flavobacterium psychrophilum]